MRGPDDPEPSDRQVYRTTGKLVLLLRLIVPARVAMPRKGNVLTGCRTGAPLGFLERHEFTGPIIPTAEPAFAILFARHLEFLLWTTILTTIRPEVNTRVYKVLDKPISICYR